MPYRMLWRRQWFQVSQPRGRGRWRDPTARLFPGVSLSGTAEWRRAGLQALHCLLPRSIKCSYVLLNVSLISRERIDHD